MRRVDSLHDEQVVLDELADYEHSVLPALEALIDRTLEQALVEVIEEEEIKEIRRRRAVHRDRRTAELTLSHLLQVTDE